MTKSNDAEIAALFSQAERKGRCLVPSSRRVREIVRRQIEQGEAVRASRGMYARASYWRGLPVPQRTLHILRSAQHAHPDWVFCHESAAVAFDLPVSFDKLNAVDVVSSPANRNAASAATRWHVVENDEFVVRRGLRVTSLPRTVFDCMRTSDFGRALAVADGAVRLSGSRSSAFVSRFHRINNGHAGSNHAIRTMRYADARSESGGESIARASMIEQGFALPQLQAALPQPFNANRSFRVDFLWTRLDGSKVIGEFDGMQKYEDARFRNGCTPLRVLAEEQHRESQLTLYGMPILRLSYKDVMNPSTFARILKGYGVPQSDEIARSERRLARSKSTTAQIFTVASLRD